MDHAERVDSAMRADPVKRWLGITIGLALVLYLLWRMPWTNAFQTLRGVRLVWWLPALAIGALGVWLRSLRLLWVLGTQEPLRAVWRAVAQGYLAGLVLPVGGGELVKLRGLTRIKGLKLLNAGSGLALDRLLDLLGLTIGLGVLSLLQTLPGHVGNLLHGMGLLVVLAAFCLALFLARGRALLDRLKSATSNSPWLASRLERIGEVLDEAEHLRASRTWFRLLLLQMGITVLEVLTTSLAIKAIPFTAALPAWAGLQVLMFNSIGFALPLLPGGTGTLQVASILALRPWGVPISQSLAFGLLSQVGHLLVVLGHGGVASLLNWNSPTSGNTETT